MQAESIAAPARAGKYLTFVLDNEEYGLPIIKVREILGIMPVTPIPQAPHFVRGVINLRGTVIPVVDTRTKFGMPERDSTPETCIIVVEVDNRSLGLIVDTVREVVDIAEDQVEDTPAMGRAAGDGGFILGIGKVDDHVMVLLDIDLMLADLHVGGMEI